MIIKRVGPLAIAKLSGMLYAALGLVFGGITSLVSLAGGFPSDTAGGPGIWALVGVGAVFFFPILYGVMGFVMTLLGAWLYNVAAGVVGGIELEVQ